MNLERIRPTRRFLAALVGAAAVAFGGRTVAEEVRLALPSEFKTVVALQDAEPATDKQAPTPAKSPRPASVESQPMKAPVSDPKGDPEPRDTRDAADDGVGPVGGPVSQGDQPPAEKPAAVPADEPLKPIADPLESPPVEIEAASLKGVVPGVATIDEVDAAWGVPKEIRKVDGTQIHRYSVAPFDRIEVTFVENKCTAIVVRLQKAFPAEAVAKQLSLDAIRPVFVSDELGEVLGQAYPERGVLFTFVSSQAPGKPSMSVSEIVLEPITAEPFVLRAELTMDHHAQAALRDVDAALTIDPKNSRALWFRARLLGAAGEQDKAMAAISTAVATEPNNPQYRITRAQTLAQLGKLAEAAGEAKKAVELSKTRPHVKARALCLLGDLTASGPKPDFAQAFSLHEAAVKTAGAAAEQKHPAVRIAAKEAMLDAYLGAARDIAWGNYSEKEKAVKVWLDLASAAAEDLIAAEGANTEVRFRVATHAIRVCVGMRGAIDPAPWAKSAVESGQALIDSSRDAVRRARFEWELGSALYDAMQASQLKRDSDAAVKIGRQAVEHIEAAAEQRPTPATAYLLGRLYFRLGAFEATRDKNHAAAVEWFDKALAQFAKPMPPEVAADTARQGETLVIMGVSYWEVGQRDRSLDLTTRGVAIFEQAVKQGSLAESSLAIPYGNLAAMHKELGKSEAADRYHKMASKAKGGNLK